MRVQKETQRLVTRRSLAAGGDTDEAKLKAYSDSFNAAAVELARLYSEFDKKRAEVGALVGK